MNEINEGKAMLHVADKSYKIGCRDTRQAIRAEIERRIELYRGTEHRIDPNRIDEDESLLSFIDELPEERTKRLTWKDIIRLERIINQVHYEYRNGIGQESFGEAVLEQFYLETEDDQIEGNPQQFPLIPQKDKDSLHVSKICKENGDSFTDEVNSYWNKATGFQPKFAIMELKRDGFAKVAKHFYDLGKEETNNLNK